MILGSKVAGTPDAVRGESLRRGVRIVRFAQRQALLAVLGILVVTFALVSPYFFVYSNFLNIGSLSAVLGLMAIPETALLISGGIDISVGSVAATSSVTLGVLYTNGVNIWLAVALVLLLGATVGTVNGAVAIFLGVDPLVTTLGTYSLFLGLAYVISGTQTVIITATGFTFPGQGSIAGIPFALLLFLVLFGGALFVERMTRFGRSVYVIGGNIEAARNAGLRVNSIRLTLYVLSGLGAALAGVILTSALSSSAPDLGDPYLLGVITAVILGGASLRGGRGTLVGTLIAIAILGVLQNGFALLQFSSFAYDMVLGGLLVIAVLLDQRLRILERKSYAVASRGHDRLGDEG